MNLTLGDRPCGMAEDLSNLSYATSLDSEPLTVQITGDAAQQLQSLQVATGQSAETVLAMSLGLLETLIQAQHDGRHMMLVSRYGLPLRKVVLPS